MLKANRKHTTILVLAAMFLCGFTFTAYFITGISYIEFGYDAGDGKGPVCRSRLWPGPDGTLTVQSCQENTATRIMLLPVAGGDQRGANAELTIYGETDEGVGHPEGTFERVSVTQMNNNERHVRFSMEAGGLGQFRPFEFCYDTYTFVNGEPIAYCPLRIDPDPAKGVQVCDINNACTRLGG